MLMSVQGVPASYAYVAFIVWGVFQAVVCFGLLKPNGFERLVGSAGLVLVGLGIWGLS